jgi:uncharacterized repeat protein (TIGR01451 family)
VYATSFNEGRRDLTSVLQVSTDGGNTWSGRLPAAPANCVAVRAGQPSGFGIALRPGTSEALVGTNCGLARTTDGGDHWNRFDPTPGNAAGSVWDAAALPSGRTYACGDDGLLVSPTGADGTWTALGRPASTSGFCSLAVSPEESNVVFIMFGIPRSFGEVFGVGGGRLFQGVVAFDASTGTPSGVTWLELPNPDASIGGAKFRLPFVVTNDRSSGYDVWTGIGNLVRGTCNTPATLPAPNTPRCSAWSNTYTDMDGMLPQNAHGDSGDVTFDPSQSVDACPTLYSSDGGIYRNSLAQDPTLCHDPNFVGSNSGLHAFLLWDMEGVNIPGADAEDLYFGTQDNGLYYTSDGGATSPVWNHRIGGDTYDFAANAVNVAASTNGNEVLAGDRGFLNMTTAVPGGTFLSNPPLDIPEFIARAGGSRFMIAIAKPTSLSGTPIPIGIRDTNDIVNDPFGTALGTWPSSAQPPCHIVVGASPAGAQPYALAGRCFWPDSGSRIPFAGDQLWTYRENSSGVLSWAQIDVPPKNPGDPVSPGAGFGLIAVDPGDANRLYASVVLDGDPRMMRSVDGGDSWVFDEVLTDLMSGSGGFIPYPAVTGDGIYPYLQPLFVAFDPADPNILVAGGASSGVFISSDGGLHWSMLTDPLTPGTSGIPHLPRPMFAHFDHDKPGFVRIYLGTGRGVWRVEIPLADLRITKTDMPDPAFSGESLTYGVTVVNNGPSDATDVTVQDTLPAGVEYAGTSGSCSESPPGTLECTVGTLAAGAQTSFTITVNIPPDLVYLNGGPKTITNSASVSSGEIDPDLSNNTTSEQTLVKAKSDVAIVAFAAVAPPAEVLIGQPVNLTLRKIITNQGPSSPVDVTVSRSAIAPPGSIVSPVSSSETAIAVLKDELRTIDETFTITCGAPGVQTFSFANMIMLANSADIDPDHTNNTTTAAVSVECVLPVAINIKPGSFPNSIDLENNGVIPIAILTTSMGEYGTLIDFDAATIDPFSVRFGPYDEVWDGTGGAPIIHKQGHLEDSFELDETTMDGDLDLMLHFSTQATGIESDDVEACAKGAFAGVGGAVYHFFGCDLIRIVPPLYNPTQAVANFFAHNTTGSALLTVHFINNSAAPAGTTWQWDFGDGNTSSEANSTHTFNAGGIYKITLMAVGPNNTDTLVRTNFVNTKTVSESNPMFIPLIRNGP